MQHASNAALLFGALMMSGCGQHLAQSGPAAHARSSAGEITRANFVSLQEARAGGFAYVEFHLSISGKTVQLHPGALKEKVPTLRAKLSPTEMQALIKVLNEARFTHITGNYENPGAADAISHTVTLSLRQPGQARSQTFTVSDNVGRAPKSFDKVVGFLRTLHIRKFPHAQRGQF